MTKGFVLHSNYVLLRVKVAFCCTEFYLEKQTTTHTNFRPCFCKLHYSIKAFKTATLALRLHSRLLSSRNWIFTLIASSCRMILDIHMSEYKFFFFHHKIKRDDRSGWRSTSDDVIIVWINIEIHMWKKWEWQKISLILFNITILFFALNTYTYQLDVLYWTRFYFK